MRGALGKGTDGLVAIQSTDFWVKVAGMLQQTWALIEPEAMGVRVYFITDTSGVFDEIALPSAAAASQALDFNGYRRFADHEDLQSFLCPPPAPLYQRAHPNGAIYSSGRFWVS